MDPDEEMTLDEALRYKKNAKIGDVVEIRFASGRLKFRVLELKESVRKEEAASLYEMVAE